MDQISLGYPQAIVYFLASTLGRRITDYHSSQSYPVVLLVQSIK